MVIMENIVVLQQLKVEIKDINLNVRKPIFLHTNKIGADQTAHLHNLISAFVVCSMESLTSVHATLKDSKF